MNFLTKTLNTIIDEHGKDCEADGRRWATAGITLSGGALSVQGKVAQDGDGYVMIIQQPAQDAQGRQIMAALWLYFEGKDLVSVNAPIENTDRAKALMVELGLMGSASRLHTV